MPDEIDAIIARMSEAQKRKLFAIGDGQPVEFALGQSGLFLIERGFAFVNELGARHLTDRGCAVRARLKENTDEQIKQAEALCEQMRELSKWLIANDVDMRLPDEAGDPAEAADTIAPAVSATLTAGQYQLDARLEIGSAVETTDPLYIVITEPATVTDGAGVP